MTKTEKDQLRALLFKLKDELRETVLQAANMEKRLQILRQIDDVVNFVNVDLDPDDPNA
jgi:hypothetical protein